MSSICCTELVRRYDSHVAVDNMSLGIHTGELFGLLGPNGAGKSTTIKMMVGLLAPNSGQITVEGRPLGRETRRKMGLVPQEIAIYETLSAQENVEYFASLYGLKGRELREKTREALDFVGLGDKAKQKPKTFSGGMKRRLNIACAIAHNPSILIMDEPTVGIDPQSRNHILESVKELNHRGMTIIYTSHYMEEVEFLCPRVGIMDHGRLIACGTKEALEKQISAGECIQAQIDGGDETLLTQLRQIPGVQRVDLTEGELQLDTVKAQQALGDVFFILGKNEIKVRNIRIQEPNLESLFLELTGRRLRD